MEILPTIVSGSLKPVVHTLRCLIGSIKYLIIAAGAAIDSREGCNTTEADCPETGVQAEERPSHHIDSSSPVGHLADWSAMRCDAQGTRRSVMHISANPQVRWA